MAHHLDPGLGSFLKGGDEPEGARVPDAVGSHVSREALPCGSVPGEKQSASVSLQPELSALVWRSPEVLHGPSFSSISACCMSPCSLSLELSAWWGRKDLKQSYFTENVSQVSLTKDARSDVERRMERWIDVLLQGSVACCLLTQIKFYWHTTMSICFRIIRGCFCAVTAELSSCDRPYGSERHLVFTPFKETDLPVSDLQAVGDRAWAGLGRESLSE